MHRKPLLDMLLTYEATWGGGLAPYRGFDKPSEASKLAQLREFVQANADCFERSHADGHVTGSALVLTPDYGQVLLTLHRKLGRWLQLGGHADGNPDIAGVAMREAQEESGSEALKFLAYEKVFGPSVAAPLAFDLDIHQIPATPREKEHFHYDVRFLLVALKPETVALSEESLDLKWHSLADAYKITDEPGMHRQFDKVAYLKERL